jgi:hypothetical protein
MFFQYVLTAEFVLSFTIPILIAWLVWLHVWDQWRDVFHEEPDKKVKYKTESFRNPINLSVTIAGLLIPVISALIAFLVTNLSRPQIEGLSSLFAALCILILSMCAGAFLSYGLATASPNEDAFLIGKEKYWRVPADFAAQLILLLSGIVLLIFFLLVRLELPAKPDVGKTSNTFSAWDGIWMRGIPEREIVFELLRGDLDIGVPESVIREKWGQADKIERSAEERITRYVYTSPHSTYTISCRDGVVLSFLVHKTDNPGGVR